MKGIKESKELLEGVKVLAVSAKKIAKDGVSLADLPEALELIKKIDILVEAVKGVDGIDEEVKDLDQAELVELGVAVFDIVKAIKGA
jgi:hypothetical protein